MGNKPLVSIVTRTKNRPVTLQRLLENLTKQKYKNFEWIIVNDCGSRDYVNDIRDKALSLGLITKTIHNSTSKGRSYPVNLGAEKASGKYMLILDDDDYLHEDCLLEMVDYVEKYDWLGGVAVHTRVVYEAIDANSIKQIGKGRLYAPKLDDFLFYNQKLHH